MSSHSGRPLSVPAATRWPSPATATLVAASCTHQHPRAGAHVVEQQGAVLGGRGEAQAVGREGEVDDA